MNTELTYKLYDLCDKYVCHNENELQTIASIVARQFSKAECYCIPEIVLYKEALCIATSYFKIIDAQRNCR